MLFLIEVWKKSEKVESMVLIFASSRFDLFFWLNKNDEREEEFFGWGFNCYLKWFSHCIVPYYELSSRSTNFLSYFITINIIHRWKFQTFQILKIQSNLRCYDPNFVRKVFRRINIGARLLLSQIYWYPKINTNMNLR